MDNAFVSHLIEDRSYVSYIKREIHSAAVKAKFSKTKIGEIDIVVSELTSNLVKHAGNGELLYRIEQIEDDASIELISIDNGPGISDTTRMIRDGVSTTQTLGQGLGAIHRLSNTAQIYSRLGWGTIVYSLIKNKAVDQTTTTLLKGSSTIDINALCVAKPREVMCGDGYRIRHTQTGLMIFFADGLGHGESAKEAVDLAGDFFMECKETDPVSIIRGMHEQIRKSRGLVGTVSVFDSKTNEFRFCGVGNIHTRFYNGIESRNFMSYNGTIGLNIPNTISSSGTPIEHNQHLILCSDGIQSRWDLTRYPGISRFNTMILAASIYKDFNRRNDDASVLIAKIS